jgi:hypothetical protein
MSVSIFPTFNNTGVRNLSLRSGLGGVPCLAGFSTDILTGMITDGYDPSVLNALFAANASDAQMQSLWDNYGAGTPEFANAASLLLFQLRGSTGAAAAPGYPALAQPQPLPTGTQFQNGLKASGAIPVGSPWSTTPPSQTYAASSPAGVVYLPPSPPPGPTDWTSWLQNNSGKILLVIALVAVAPPLLKKL